MKFLKRTVLFFTNTLATTETYFNITESFCKNIHSLMTKDTTYNGNIAGSYRNMMVNVGDHNHGGIYTPPRTLDDIKTLMAIFIDWINSDAVLTMGPFIRAALAHYYIALIHPFQDGNGRTARFIEASILRASGISCVAFVMSNY